jgi:cystathionine gamma-lyase
VWIETPTNPTLRLPDIPHFTGLIRRSFSPASRPLIIVDSTFLSPFYISPLAAPIHADVVLHSITKYINGHSDVLMGALIFPNKEIGDSDALYQKLLFLQNAHGAVPGAFDAWLAMRGAKTLALRMREHGRNAVKLARMLRQNRHVKEVIYPGLREHPGHEVARQLLSTHAKKFVDEWVQSDEEAPGGDFPFGGMVSFRIAGDEGAAERFLTRTRLFTLAESLGGVESLAEVPEKMTHGVRHCGFHRVRGALF